MTLLVTRACEFLLVATTPPYNVVNRMSKHIREKRRSNVNTTPSILPKFGCDYSPHRTTPATPARYGPGAVRCGAVNSHTAKFY